MFSMEWIVYSIILLAMGTEGGHAEWAEKGPCCGDRVKAGRNFAKTNFDIRGSRISRGSDSAIPARPLLAR